MKFKLGYFNWLIKFVDYTLKSDEGEDAHGITLLDDKIIKVETNKKNTQMEKETLFHELMHSAFGDSDLVSDEIEERLILLLSPRLMEILEHKKIRDYLFGGK